MAGLLTAKNEPNEWSSAVESGNTNNSSNYITIFDLALLILSLFSIFVDFCTDLILVIHYSSQGYKFWAVATVLLTFFPSAIIQFFSWRWHLAENTANSLTWMLHICMLGIVHRYIQVIKFAFAAFKSKKLSDVQKVFFDQNDLCLLHLFESFLESAPQLVLQLYVIAKVNEWRFWTGLSVLASLLSLAWAFTTYNKAQRRARIDKNLPNCYGLLFQAVWRIGMLTSRIAAFVLAAYSFGNYIFPLVTVHWMAMTIWITYQKTDFCETYWEEKIYNAVVGVIYCFCFFNLQEGQSRWRAFAFYLIVIIQNLICLTVFLMWFDKETPKLSLYGFIAIIGGITLGLTGILIYYRFFHPSGPIRFFASPQPKSAENLSPQLYSSLTLRSLKKIRSEFHEDYHQKATLQSNSKLDKNSFLDSIVIIEENTLDDTDSDIKKLENWINEPNSKDQAASELNKNETEAYKRKAICTSTDLVKLLEVQRNLENVNSRQSIDEAPSEILSVHDYENLCSVNIYREPWGLRSWRGYFDMETGLHDDSVVYSRDLGTLSNTSSSSSNALQTKCEATGPEDNVDAEQDPVQDESKVDLDYILGRHMIHPLPNVPCLNLLEPILEEEDDELNTIGTELIDLKGRNGYGSTLVATIEEIRKNTPVRRRHWLSDDVYDALHSPFLSEGKLKLNMNSKNDKLPLKLLISPENKTQCIDVNENEPSQKQTDDTDKNDCKNN